MRRCRQLALSTAKGSFYAGLGAAFLSALLMFSAHTQAASISKSRPALKAVDPFPAPDFELMDLDDNLHRLSDYRGKVVIVNFWATWCPPCRQEMPSMNHAYRALKDDGVVMLGVNVGESFDAVFGFTAEILVDFPLLVDTASEVSGQYPIRGLPTTYIINPNGEIVYQAVGGREWDDDEILDSVRALIE